MCVTDREFFRVISLAGCLPYSLFRRLAWRDGLVARKNSRRPCLDPLPPQSLKKIPPSQPRVKTDERKIWPLKFSSAIVAYLMAMSFASIAFVLTGNFLSAATPETADSASSGMRNLLIEICMFWVIPLGLAICPYLLGILIARHYQIRRWQYFVGGSTLTALGLLLPLSTLVINSHYHDDQSAASFLELLLNGLPPFLFCSSTAGFICWLYLRWAGLRKLSEKLPE